MQPNDVVVLVSDKVEKTFLSVSHMPALNRAGQAQALHAYVQQRLEVNANAEGTKIKLIPCAQAPTVLELDTHLPKTVDTLKGGDAITFFHRETESYLVFDSSNTSSSSSTQRPGAPQSSNQVPFFRPAAGVGGVVKPDSNRYYLYLSLSLSVCPETNTLQQPLEG